MNKKLSDFDGYQIYSKWRSGSGPFKCYFRSTNFVSLKQYPDFELLEIPGVRDLQYDLLMGEIDKLALKETMIIIDLSGCQALEAAFHMQKERKVKGLLTFNNILHPYGLTGSKEFISRLMLFGDMLTPSEYDGYAIILDYDRFGDYDEDDLRKKFNNQYELAEDDLPTVSILKELGYKKLAYFYKAQVKEDVAEYLKYLEQNGLDVSRITI